MGITDTVHVTDKLTVTTSQGKTYSPVPHDNLTVTGHVKITLKDKEGKILHVEEGNNIITLYGKEWLARHICWLLWGGTPATSTPDAIDGVLGRPDHAVLYIGAGSGGVLEQASITQLGTPVAYDVVAGIPQYRKEVTIPVVHPSASISRFETTFLDSELSLGGPVDINEFGLFLDSATPSVATSSPIAYKVTGTIPKTNAFSMLVEWEVRFA